MNSPQCGSEAVSDGTRMAATLSPPGGVTGKARIRVPASNASTGAPRSPEIRDRLWGELRERPFPERREGLAGPRLLERGERDRVNGRAAGDEGRELLKHLLVRAAVREPKEDARPEIRGPGRCGGTFLLHPVRDEIGDVVGRARRRRGSRSRPGRRSRRGRRRRRGRGIPPAQRRRRHREGVAAARRRGRDPVRVRGRSVQERDRRFADRDPVAGRERGGADDRAVEGDVGAGSRSENVEPKLVTDHRDPGVPSENTPGAHDEVVARRSANVNDIAMNFPDFRLAAGLPDLEAQHGSKPPGNAGPSVEQQDPSTPPVLCVRRRQDLNGRSLRTIRGQEDTWHAPPPRPLRSDPRTTGT